jgi:hypothetical protein
MQPFKVYVSPTDQQIKQKFGRNIFYNGRLVMAQLILGTMVDFLFLDKRHPHHQSGKAALKPPSQRLLINSAEATT